MTKPEGEFEPRPHQRAAIKFFQDKSSDALRVPLITGKTPSLQELTEHFDAHPELWDKNHPDYGKGPYFHDYISLVAPTPMSPEERASHERIRAAMKEFSEKFPFTPATYRPARSWSQLDYELFITLEDERRYRTVETGTATIRYLKSRHPK